MMDDEGDNNDDSDKGHESDGENDDENAGAENGKIDGHMTLVIVVLVANAIVMMFPIPRWCGNLFFRGGQQRTTN